MSERSTSELRPAPSTNNVCSLYDIMYVSILIKCINGKVCFVGFCLVFLKLKFNYLKISDILWWSVGGGEDIFHADNTIKCVQNVGKLLSIYIIIA